MTLTARYLSKRRTIIFEQSGDHGKAVAIQGDVSKGADVKRLFAESKKAFGDLNILGNNAGIFQLHPIETVTEEEFHRQFNTNVLGTLLGTREAVQYFGTRGGNVINVSSVVSENPVPGSAIYAATKGTHAIGMIGGDFEKQIVAGTPLGRIGQPQDIAKVAVFLASEESSWLIGERISASGGFRSLTT